MSRYVNEVVSNVYISSYTEAFDDTLLKKIGITHIINLSELGNMFPNDFVYYKIDIDDIETENISKYFDNTNKFIENALFHDDKVLVHCYAGISRSATIVMSFLMYKYGLSTDDALNFLRQVRPIVNPNSGFISQLYQYYGR